MKAMTSPTLHEKPIRFPWPRQGFPAVDIHAAESRVKKHPAYDGAKAGDAGAAVRLVAELVNAECLAVLTAYRAANPLILPVHGIERVSVNSIPLALAVYAAEALAYELAVTVVQISRAGHTGATGWRRLGSPALFEGEVSAGRPYILIDDFIGMGGTLANLRGYVLSNGGRVLHAQAFTGKPRSATLALRPETLNALREKHGSELEHWWWAAFGHGLDALTESEARYLLRAEDVDTIRNRLVEAAHA